MTAKTKPKTEGAQFVKYFGPVSLRGLGDSGTPEEVVERVARDLGLSDEAQNELLPSGKSRFRNQVHWARFYLVREGLVAASKRGVWSLTENGRNKHLTNEEAREIFLKWVKIFQDQRRQEALSNEPVPANLTADAATETAGYRSQVLDVIMNLPVPGFEKLSQRILREAGFTQVEVTGRSGDEGIDGYGTLQINALVSFKVLFQCKRYRKSVSPNHIRDFRGAMAGRADKGIVITTGTFTAEARREATRDGVPPIELIDGERLVDMLEQFELGLKPKKSFELDGLFFKEFMAG